MSFNNHLIHNNKVQFGRMVEQINFTSGQFNKIPLWIYLYYNMQLSSKVNALVESDD